MVNGLFSPYQLGGLSLRNRICRSATNDYAGNEDGTVSQAQMAIYRALAQHEVGLIFTGHACVSPHGRADGRQNAMYGDEFIPAQQALTQMVHALGGCIVQQLSHAGGKSLPLDGPPPAPSAMEYVPGRPARALSPDEILQIQDNFAAAAVRARAAGYDGVQIHCAHGYLLSEFIDPAWNRRTDAYGGAIPNGLRMARETIGKTRQAVGANFPIFIKIHCNTQGEDPDYLQTLAAFLDECARMGVVAAEISGYDFAKQPPTARRYYLDKAQALAKRTALPLILVGGLRDRADLQAALDGGMAMASVCRALICQDDFVLRAHEGDASDCLGCFGCFQCYQKTGKRCVLHR